MNFAARKVPAARGKEHLAAANLDTVSDTVPGRTDA